MSRYPWIDGDIAEEVIKYSTVHTNLTQAYHVSCMILSCTSTIIVVRRSLSPRKNAHNHGNISMTNRASCSHIWHAHSTRYSEPCMSARRQCEVSTIMALRGTLRSSRQRLMQLPPLLITTPLKSSLESGAPDWPRPRLRCCFCRLPFLNCGTSCRTLWNTFTYSVVVLRDINA